PQPWLAPPRLVVSRACPQIPVQRPGRLVPDPDHPRPAALAADGDLPGPQIHITAPGATGSYPDAGRQDIANLFPGAAAVPAPADQGAWIRPSDRDVVVVTDQPSKDRRRSVGAVLAVTAEPPFVRRGDLGFDVRQAGRNTGLPVGDRRGHALS